MTRIRGCEITLREGDITAESTEAIVNAANASLLGGGGVDGAIHAKAGPTLLEECREIRRTTWPEGLPTGQAVLTGGGRLTARFVIHTVGPVWQGGRHGEPQALRSAYTNCLRVAEAHGISSIAFPSISTGAYGYPIGEASRIAVGAVLEFLNRSPASDEAAIGHHLREVAFVLFSRRDHAEYETALQEALAARDDRS